MTDDATLTQDRSDVIDTYLGMLEGIDSADASLLDEFFADDVVFDLSRLASLSRPLEPYVGKQAAIDSLLSSVGKLDTMHALTNIRVFLDGDTATATAYLLGQHFRPGRGPSTDFNDQLWRGNRFVTEFARGSDGRWRVTRNTVTTSWNLGNVAATNASS